ncbi:hypothetical protein MUS1_07230 [Marinomonas ushuaiensis DSM 15871]|uniref:Uncharacterized protein n=1 Tax=Marinomonas ushuaiensis DSM 15871 TaxID=1122207 RepID=X7E7Y8_9GAMM|nr:hypothetical protein MUS1_07230 [Marinomonas ushuaiensis DSM 15871]
MNGFSLAKLSKEVLDALKGDLQVKEGGQTADHASLIVPYKSQTQKSPAMRGFS